MKNTDSYEKPKAKRKQRSCLKTSIFTVFGLGICGVLLLIVLTILGPIIGSHEIVYVEQAVSINAQPINISYQLPEIPARGGILNNDFSFQVDTHTVDVTIEDNLADVHHELTITNIGSKPIEGVFVIPLPLEYLAENFMVTIDEQEVETQPYEVDTGQERLQSLAYANNDYALLAFTNNPFVEIDIFPLNGTHTISFTYQTSLDMINGLLELDIPLAFPSTMNRTISEFDISISATNEIPIRNIYPATIDLSILQEEPNAFIASASIANYQPAQNIELYYAPSTEEMTINLLSYRENSSEDGYFTLLVEPPAVTEEIVPQDVLLVLDRSGSMQGIKWQQAQSAANFVLENLNPDDRFFVTTFSDSHAFFDNNLSPVASSQDAVNWINGRDANGGTNINDALLETLNFTDIERSTTLIFMTDGQATNGETDTQAILSNLHQAVSDNVRIFVFGVGDNVNTTLLDSIAQEFRGATAYVRQNETIDEEIGRLYSQISSPVLTNISLDFGDIIASDFIPTNTLPDLYAGQQLILVGRYREGAENNTITLTGNANGVIETYTIENQVFQSERGGESIAMQLWATRRIGEMLNSVRLGDDNPELVTSIVSLSLRYGILTPYTQFLIEQDNVLSVSGQEIANEQMRINISSLQSNQTGAYAVDTADLLNNLSSSRNAVATQSYGYSSGSCFSSCNYSRQTITVSPTPLPAIGTNGYLLTILSQEDELEVNPSQYILSLNDIAFVHVQQFLPEDFTVESPYDLPRLINNLVNTYGIEQGIEIYNDTFGAYLPLVPAEYAQVGSGYVIAPPPIVYQPPMRTIMEKTYILQEGRYLDTTYEPDNMALTNLNIDSDEYISLIENNPDILPYISVGVPLIIVWDGTVYEILGE